MLKRHSRAARLAAFAAPALATFCFPSTVRAAALDPGGTTPPSLPWIDLSQTVYEGGQAADIDIFGVPGELPFLLIAGAPGPTQLPGLGTLGVAIVPPPMIVRLPVFPPSGKLELSCNFGCNSPLLQSPCYLQVISIDLQAQGLGGLSNTVTLTGAGGDCGICADTANDDGYGPNAGGHAVTMPGIGKFVFESGGQFIERADGTAKLTGVVVSPSDSTARFFMDVEFTQRLDPGDALFPPAGSPKQELKPAAYWANGGSVIPENWHYYTTTLGALTGIDAYEGAALTLDGTGPAFQVGLGANGKNVGWGGSGWLTVNVLTQPVTGSALNATGGDINIDLGDCPGGCPEAAIVDSNASTSSYDHAFYLPGIGKDFVLLPGASFTEHADGTASYTGTIQRTSAPTESFQVDLQLSGRINPGNVNYPPSGSPKIAPLKSSMLVENGGIVDTSTWYYYATTTGTLTGLGDYQDAEFDLQGHGPPFQIGFGASLKNEDWGASSWFKLNLTQQSQGPLTLPTSEIKGDTNINLDRCPPTAK